MAMFICIAFTAYNQQSVLRSGNWVKFSVDSRGVYKIDAELLKKAGIDPATINPKKIQIFGQGGGMLPQPNAIDRPYDLVENAITVSGESDGKFDNNDLIIFFAEGADEVSFDTERQTFSYEHNLYDDNNFYFLTIGNTDGKRVKVIENIEGTFPVIDSYNEYSFHETDTHNELASGRQWFGENFDITVDRTFPLSIDGIRSGSTIQWISHVMARNEQASPSFNLSYNNVPIETQIIQPSSSYRYGIKGQIAIDTLEFSANSVSAQSQTTQELRYRYVKGTGSSRGYLDFFLLHFVRNLALYGNQTVFRSEASLAQPISTFHVASADNVSIWNITTPNEPSSQSFTVNGGVARFSALSTSLDEYVVFNNNLLTPQFIDKVETQNLHGLTTPNLLIITHPDFVSEAQRLAAHRKNHSGLAVELVTVQSIYNEFSSGRQDVTAIRDFIRHLYLQDPSQLKNVLIIGRSSYDYKNRLNNNTNFVPTYASRNSLHPLETYSSDDYFGFMEANEGEWGEGNFPVNHTLEVGVGRLPVKTIDELRDVVDKLIDYDLNKNKAGRWRKEITFVADDGNTDDGFSIVHQQQANNLARFIEDGNPQFDTKRIFIGMHPKVIRPSGETSPSVNEAINSTFERGTLIMNYTGHGSERVWADERILSDFTIPTLDNSIYPFMVTATCEFGRQDDPTQISTAERVLLRPKSGVIGLVSTARPVNSSTNYELNSAFYEALFIKGDNGYRSIGEVFCDTKNNSTSGVANRNFSLLGDPSMHLAMPTNHIEVTSIETESSSASLKALSRVIIKGEVRDIDDNVMTTYSGKLEATLFDKQTEFKTIGKNLFTFKEWFNALFRGQASVDDGEFELRFIVPKNIAYELGEGKLSLYASDPEFADAAGGDLSFLVGESEQPVPDDDTSPTIELFMGDTTFRNGGITNPDTYLVARLSDASGINISSYGIGNDIVAELDGESAFILNDYYISDQDNFQRGHVYFPMNGLSPGRHSIKVKAWDTYNNPAEAEIEFIVTDGKGIVIESFGNYPNPAQDQTTFFFTHNRSGDDVEAHIDVLNATGMVLKTIDFTFTGSSYRAEFPVLDLGKNLSAGLYFARLVIRSVTNASKTERVTKLIILN
jgi:hypothetical protein